jgi:hypothetical protein
MESDGNQNNADLGNGARKAVEAIRTPYFFVPDVLPSIFSYLPPLYRAPFLHLTTP